MTSPAVPILPLGDGPSFGFGDRIGSATPGHIEAMRQAGDGVLPVFAQQSIREMQRTSRTPEGVMRDAVAGILAAGWSSGTGADADHLKTPDDVDATAAVGFRLFTLDPSAHVVDEAETASTERLQELLNAAGAESAAWLSDRVGTSEPLDTGDTLSFSEEECFRAIAKLGRAIDEAIALGRHAVAAAVRHGGTAELELSVDETETPTSLIEHWFAAERFRAAGLPLRCIAPRFPGSFEKGIDHLGDRATLLASIDRHAAIARATGGHKLSLHSGSDKLSVYGPLARATQGRFHVKTAGTSYLEALRVAARRDPAFFAEIVAFARARFETDRATYHLSAKLADAPDPSECRDPAALERAYLGTWSEVEDGRGFEGLGRQIVHCTFGSVLGDATLGTRLRELLQAEQTLHTELLAEHFARHLRALCP
jgi:hypothetical protein